MAIGLKVSTMSALYASTGLDIETTAWPTCPGFRTRVSSVLHEHKIGLVDLHDQKPKKAIGIRSSSSTNLSDYQTFQRYVR